MNPYQISVLLHLYSRTDELPVSYFERGSTFSSVLNALRRECYIDISTDTIRNYDLTEKGMAYVRQILATPPPVSQWINPQTGAPILSGGCLSRECGSFGTSTDLTTTRTIIAPIGTIPDGTPTTTTQSLRGSITPAGRSATARFGSADPTDNRGNAATGVDAPTQGALAVQARTLSLRETKTGYQP